jgi:hypothetical protein
MKISRLLILCIILVPVSSNGESLDISKLIVGECFTAESFKSNLKQGGWKKIGEGLDSQTRHVVHFYHHNKWNRLLMVRTHFVDNEPKFCIIEAIEQYKPAKKLGLF